MRACNDALDSLLEHHDHKLIDLVDSLGDIPAYHLHKFLFSMDDLILIIFIMAQIVLAKVQPDMIYL